MFHTQDGIHSAPRGPSFFSILDIPGLLERSLWSHCHSAGAVPYFQKTSKRCVNQNSPTISRAFSISGRLSFGPGTMPLRSVLTTSESLPGIFVWLPWVFKLWLLSQRTYLSSQALSSWVIGLPEFPPGQLKIFLHSFTEFLPHPGFCFSNHWQPSDINS